MSADPRPNLGGLFNGSTPPERSSSISGAIGPRFLKQIPVEQPAGEVPTEPALSAGIAPPEESASATDAGTATATEQPDRRHPLSSMDPATVMSADDCVDAALAGLDMGEQVTFPSVEDAQLWKNFEDAAARLFQGAMRGQPASRYLAD